MANGIVFSDKADSPTIEHIPEEQRTGFDRPIQRDQLGS
jgi:hypothetical protein